METGQDAVNILCLEGAEPLGELEGLVSINANTPDRYNDCVALFWKEADESVKNKGVLRGVLRVRVLRATTEPGRYWTQLHPNPAGAANLVWGHHLYKRGRHRGHPALVSASGIDRVWRDRDADFAQDISERVQQGRFGIHVHAGGRGESIGRWSAGCIAIQGGYEGEAYRFFLERIERHPGRLFNLTLWGARDLGNWMRARGQPEEPYTSGTGVTGVTGCVTGAGVTGWRPTLRYGIKNPWVARVQKFLNHRMDARLVADGDWGPRTQEVFLGFQRQAGLVVDGVCGPLSWGKLESK
ncbi:MAG: peptidoglycan-binding domain-containing protein [candidate division WOR-3 bacterium]|nr:peptidoglycan-binding domain-containing protein [candidate division WOR-3 bacterium]